MAQEQKYDSTNIPITFTAPALMISHRPIKKDGRMLTVFVGVVNEVYDDDAWNQCKAKVKNLLQIKEDADCIEIKVVPIRRGSSSVNGDDLEQKTLKAVEMINEKCPTELRLVRMGVGSTLALFESLRFLIERWNQSPETKDLEFITTGDTDNMENFEFCKWLCMMKTCNRVGFVNTLDYNRYGFTDNNRMQLESALRNSGDVMQQTIKTLSGALGGFYQNFRKNDS